MLPASKSVTMLGGRADMGKPAPSGGLPSFVPAPGMLKSIHTNSLVSINPCPADNCWYSESSKQNGPWCNWNGAIYAEDYSDLGAMVYWGGGHGGYDGTEFYIFDFSTQAWSRLNDPVPYDFLPETSADWCDAQTPQGPTVPSSHPYSSVVYWRKAAGGGNKGSWVLPYNVYGDPSKPEINGLGTVGYRPHAVDLETGQWSRLTDNTRQPYYPAAAQGACFVDENDVIWGILGSSSDVHVKIDLKAAQPTLTNFDGHLYTPGYYWNPVWFPATKFLVGAFLNLTPPGGGVAGFILYDTTLPNNQDFYPPVLNAPLMSHGSGFGFDYCPDNNKFYAYEGFGEQVVHVLTPPAGNWKTGTWVWSTETMLGESAANVQEVVGSDGQGIQPFTKWKYIRKLKSFSWSQGTVVRNSPDGTARAGAFQLYRPLGT